MDKWLLRRLFEQEQPAPHFAFYGTVNWMRSLALLVEQGAFEPAELGSFYSSVGRRRLDVNADTLVFEQIFIAYNQLAGLIAIANSPDGCDVCRPAISTWYQVIYSAAAAMVAAASGYSVKNVDALSAAWHQALLPQGLIKMPFSPAVSTLVKEVSEVEIAKLRGANLHDLGRTPSTAKEAWGGVVSYLHGTTKFERERLEEVVRETEEFIELSVTDFRTKRAREVRDRFLGSGRVNFIVEAARYVGKANYRDSIFLSYGDSHGGEIDRFLVDLGDVATAFLRMACAFCSKRTQAGQWDEFVEDVEVNSRVTFGVDVLRVL